LLRKWNQLAAMGPGSARTPEGTRNRGSRPDSPGGRIAIFMAADEEQTPLAAGDVTAALDAMASGEPGAAARAMPIVYARLHALAEQQMQREGSGHTLQPTALVNEAYLKLVDQRSARWESRDHFLAVAAEAMRRVLIDHARRRAALKRGGDAEHVPLTETAAAAYVAGLDLIGLDEALRRLTEVDAVGARIVEMRYFGGMEVEAIARVLGIADRTVRRHWVFAKAWLSRELSPEAGDAAGGGS
jgi:RNA polymerase sigma-70 factor (ECF subfamily)